MRKFALLGLVLVLSSCISKTQVSDASRAPTPFPDIQPTIQKAVTDKRIPGAFVFVKHQGKVWTYSAGAGAIGVDQAFHVDSIVRIASMTKPVVAVATLQMVEAGKFKLNDPVSKYLPEYKNIRVLRRIDGPLTETEKPAREPTIKDLLTSTWGTGLLYFELDESRLSYPISVEIEKAKLFGVPPLPFPQVANDERSKALAKLPLMHQPGSRWMYNTSFDVLGTLLARVAQKDLGSLLKEKIFDPLHMVDTGFTVPAEKRSRFVPQYVINLEKKTFDLIDSPDGLYAKAPTFYSGAGGLVSTGADYLKFAEMLMNGGILDGTRLLSEKSVLEMTQDQVTFKQKQRSPFFPGFWDTNGWGYGVSVQVQDNGIIHKPGTYGWLGGFGTDWFNDPNNKLIGLVFTQASIDFAFFPEVRKAIYRSVPQAK